MALGTRSTAKWVALVVVLGTSVVGRAARAEEGEHASAEGAGHAEREHDEEGEETATLGLDLVLGWGRVPFALQNPPAAGNPNVTYTRSDATESNVQSFLLGGALEVAEHVEIGGRLPITFAGFSPDGSASRRTAGVGNLELEGEYSREIGHGLRIIGALGVALPTASGDAIPEDLAGASGVNTSAYDRWSLNKAAAYARGYEDNALFEPDRFGIVPKIGLAYGFRGLTIEPHVKVENLIGTRSSLDAGYVGELVASLRVGYWVARRFEVAVKGWVNVGFAGSSDDKTTAASLEPQLVLKFGPIRPYAGVIVPLAGPPSDNAFVGVRLGVAAAF